MRRRGRRRHTAAQTTRLSAYARDFRLAALAKALPVRPALLHALFRVFLVVASASIRVRATQLVAARSTAHAIVVARAEGEAVPLRDASVIELVVAHRIENVPAV